MLTDSHTAHRGLPSKRAVGILISALTAKYQLMLTSPSNHVVSYDAIDHSQPTIRASCLLISFCIVVSQLACPICTITDICSRIT